MKKIALLSFFLLVSAVSFSQVKIGLRVSPNLTLDRISDLKSSDSVKYTRKGNPMAFTIGPNIDIHLTDNISVTTGVWFNLRSATLNFDSLNAAGEEQYIKSSTQYVMLPLGIKAYTNEIFTNAKIYFGVTGIANIKVAEKFKKSNIDDFTTDGYEGFMNKFGANAQLSAGLDLQLGETTGIYGGVFFSQAFTNSASTKSKEALVADLNKLIRYKQNMLGVEVGVYF